VVAPPIGKITVATTLLTETNVRVTTPPRDEKPVDR